MSLAAGLRRVATGALRVQPCSIGVAATQSRGVHVEAKLAALGHVLPAVPAPKGSYVGCTKMGDVIFTAGHLPIQLDGELITGKVGDTVSVEEANAAAELVALNLLATLKNELGDLDRIKKVVKLVGFVNCVDGFAQQPTVINGCSDFLASVLGEAGVHSRSAVGTNALPLNVPVEIEAIVEVHESVEGFPFEYNPETKSYK